MEDSFINSLIHPIIHPLCSFLPSPKISPHVSLPTILFSLSVGSPSKSIHPFIYPSIHLPLFRYSLPWVFPSTILCDSLIPRFILTCPKHCKECSSITYNILYFLALMVSLWKFHFLDFLANLLQKPIPFSSTVYYFVYLVFEMLSLNKNANKVM